MPGIKANQYVIDKAIKGPKGVFQIQGHPGLHLAALGGGRASWRMRYRPKPGANQKWLTLSTDAANISFGDVAKRAASLRAKHELEGVDPRSQQRPQGESFDRLVRDWIEKHGKAHKRSWRADEILYERHVKSRLGQKLARTIKRQDISFALDEIERVATKRQADLSRALISAAFSWALDEGRVDQHPALRMRRRAPASTRGRSLGDDGLRRLWHDIGTDNFDDRQRDVTRLLIITGLRRSEVGAIERAEVDLGRGLISIRAERRKGWRIGKPPAPHVVPLPSMAKSILSKALATNRASRYVFPGRNLGSDQPLGLSALTNKLASRMRELGIDGARLHDIRHHVKTEFQMLGVPNEIADAVQDHARAHTIGNHYRHHDHLDEKRLALELWQLRLLEIVGSHPPAGLNWSASLDQIAEATKRIAPELFPLDSE